MERTTFRYYMALAEAIINEKFGNTEVEVFADYKDEKTYEDVQDAVAERDLEVSGWNRYREHIRVSARRLFSVLEIDTSKESLKDFRRKLANFCDPPR